jgi:hypothetical protein
MIDKEISERLSVLEQHVKFLYEKTGIPIPDLRTLARSNVSPQVQQFLGAGDTMGAIKAYRAEANVDLAAAKLFIESL